ncbi:MAG: hypothetical protein ACLVLH_17220 [Eisenbergiella massiliensis]
MRTASPHELAGAQLAEEILLDCGFEVWSGRKSSAISGHREKAGTGGEPARVLTGG